MPKQNTGSVERRLVKALRAELARVARPKNAAAMQAYMKSALPYYGVSLPDVRRACRRLLADLALPDGATWQRMVRHLWYGARRREERYCALELLGHRSARDFQKLEALPLCEELIVDGAWWDLVDEIATHCLPPLLDRYPKQMNRALLRWARGDNLWKRRSAIIAQVGRKAETDLGLLYAAIAPSLDSREIFLRKAIGWALRAYAWVDPKEIARYVTEHAGELSPLSKREALKNLK